MPAETSAPPSRERIDQVRRAVMTPMAVRAAMQLDLFTPLAGGPLTSKELAETLGVKPRRLEMLLHQLVVAEFLGLQDGRFANTELADHYLVQGRPGYIGDVHGLWTEQFTAQLRTADSIRADAPQAKIDFAGMSTDELSRFIKGLHGMASGAGRDLAKNPVFVDAETFVDVGCGSGGIAIALCQAHPHLRGSAMDLPSVVPVAREMIGEAGLADRIAVEAADVTEKPLPGRFDLAAARSLFQVLSADQCQAAARNIAAALRPGGTFFIIGQITDDTRLTPEASVGLNMMFLNVFDHGEAYPQSQYFGWLADAGFLNVVREPMLSGTSLITARKA